MAGLEPARVAEGCEGRFMNKAAWDRGLVPEAGEARSDEGEYAAGRG